MSKKFTSFLVVLAALLLTVPTQAQFAKKAAKQTTVLKAGPLKVNDVQKVKAAMAKANDKTVGIAFTGAMHQQVAAEATLLKAAINNIESDKAAFEKQMEANLNAIVTGKKPANFREFEKIQMCMNGVDRQTQTIANNTRRAGEDLVTPPATATVEAWYTAAGSFYAYSQSGWQDATSLMKTVNVAIDGNNIYIQGLAYYFNEGWIQGTINGTTATFANAQVVGEDEYGQEYIVGSDNGQTVSENIVFNYDAEEGVLEAVTKFIIENSETEEVAPYCYWVSPTFSKNEPAGPEVVTPPAGIEGVDYVMTYTTGSTPVKVAVDGNDVYFQGMSKYIPEAWVKGTKDGNNVTFAGNQYMGEYSGMESYFFYTGATTFVYDAEADTYSATGQVFGVLGGQYYDGNYTDPVLSRVVEKAGTPANPAITALTNSNYGYYITFNVPLEDTEGNALVASKLSYEIFTDVQQEVAPLTFTPATHSKLTEDMTVIPYGFTENYDFYATQIYLNDLYSASWNKIGIKSIYTGGGETHETEIQWYTIKPYGEPTAETGANVDAVPYSNALATADDFGVFGVLDSNDDGKTWSFSADYGAYYIYSSTNAANDWLISPAIKLEAGKKYHFAIDAKVAGANFPERFEVLLGTEAKASALTQSVIAATEVTAIEYVTYENAAVEVAETGYYHFGIHAISDADMFRLMVANFLVEAAPEPTAPAAVTDFAVAQTEGKLEAVVSFKAPTKTVAGDDLTDLTQIDVLRDGAVIKSLVNVPEGAVAWTASEQGYDNAQDVAAIDFGSGLTATMASGGNSNTPKYYTSGTALRMYGNNTMTITGSAIKKVVITMTGNDNQKQLTANVGEYALEGNVGTWTGSADKIVFTVVEGKQARIQKIEIETGLTLTPGAEYTVLDNAEDLTVGTHVYQVIPYNTSGIGVKSEEKSIFLSVSLEVPHTFDFSQNLLDLFTVIDNNNDGKTWQWNANGYAYYPYSEANDADDYLITLPFNLKAGKRYNVIVNARNSGFTETFEVKAGKAATVEGLTETVIAETAPTEEAEDYEGVFSPTEDGEYYFAIHATSPADQYNLIVNSLKIEIAPELTAPAAIADFTATAGAEGALEANLAFTAPAKAINDDALTGNVDVKIYRDGELVNTLTGVAAGSAQSWKDTNVENGKIYTYYVVAVNESGDGDKSEKVKVFVGVDEFAAVENIQITGTTASTMSFSWDPVTGVNGGYVNAAAAKYAVVSTHIETYLFWQYLVVDEVLGTVTGQTSATVNYDVNAGEQDYKYFGVLAYNEETEIPAAGEEYAGGYTWALVGAPYELPLFESFTGSQLHYLWDTNAALIVDQESSDDDGVAVDLLAEEPGVISFQSGKINVNGTANPTLLFNAKSPNISKLYVYASKDGGAMDPVAELSLTEGYQTFKISLANLVNQANFIQFAFAAVYNTPYSLDDEGNLVDLGDYIALDEIRVMDLYEYNLVADIQAPKSVVAGQKAKVVATVTNYGENAAKDYTVTVKAGEEVLTTVLGSEELAPFAKDEIEVEYETSIFDEAGDVNLTVTVDYENELYPEDNTASAIITITEPTATAPTSLLAEDKGAAGVDLTWTVASSDADAVSQVTEGFDDEEAFEAFTLGGITAEQHTGEVGGWTLYDGNGIGVYGFQGAEFPNAYQVAAWQVFAPAAISDSFAESYAPHSGSQFMISFCPAEEGNTPAADHWLISPVLPGVSQTISFYARALTNQYGAETFEVLASSTDKEVASFTKVADFSTDATEWTEFTADLPAGTKYFAIRHTATDVFGLLVDDVTFMTAGGAEAPASFNIYLASEQIANVEGDKTTYTVAADKLTIGENTFAVTAVYANGAESKPVTATITITTDIRQIAADGKPVDVYSIDGKLIRNQAKSLDGLKGLYIVNGKKIMVK